MNRARQSRLSLLPTVFGVIGGCLLVAYMFVLLSPIDDGAWSVRECAAESDYMADITDETRAALPSWANFLFRPERQGDGLVVVANKTLSLIVPATANDESEEIDMERVAFSCTKTLCLHHNGRARAYCSRLFLALDGAHGVTRFSPADDASARWFRNIIVEWARAAHLRTGDWPLHILGVLPPPDKQRERSFKYFPHAFAVALALVCTAGLFFTCLVPEKNVLGWMGRPQGSQRRTTVSAR